MNRFERDILAVLHARVQSQCPFDIADAVEGRRVERGEWLFHVSKRRLMRSLAALCSRGYVAATNGYWRIQPKGSAHIGAARHSLLAVVGA